MGMVNGVNMLDDPRLRAGRYGRPRRWRPYAFGGLLLLMAGVGLVLFGVDQIWGTGSETGQAQEDLAASFEDRRAELTTTTRPAAVPAASPGSTASPETTSTAPTTTSADVPEQTVPAWDDPVIAPPDATRVQLTDTVLQTEPAPVEGGVLGRIVIEDIGLDWMVVEGVRPADLNRGPGHGPWSALPGQPGNAVISGHRTTYGAPFNRIDELEPGDTIDVETLIGTHTYEVVGTIIVEPQDVWTVRDRDGAWLTLTTCHPEFSAAERLIVFAKLVGGPNAEVIAVGYPADYSLPVEPGTETITSTPAAASE
jgi:LPXTG-site transpeptidase (sortase) family protein